ncbi:KLTH0E01474p [Paecilomyces variotii No. 5]|uniref:KLTH0E01474p n=1 Tax=Byssochlamys spectabilis (strain No. 5 / NBRC 109023) TaxID=1356009 RepID=V5FPK5_BYSSN|nr:KLTH0E01474p [Paecilomyces variotii No. 5]
MPPAIDIIFGAFPMNSYSPETREEFLKLLDEYDVKAIDTAYSYTDSEKTLGELDAPARFTIHTKAPGFRPGKLKRENLLAGMEKSLRDLKVDYVDTYYLHSPDPATPMSEIMDTIQELYQAGKFKRFGISNFTTQELTTLYTYASSKSYILPTVYEGNYNPIARHSERELFPLLRKLGMSFRAYSPLAGGFLAKSPEDMARAMADKGGRFDTSTPIGKMYDIMYNRPALKGILGEWDAISREAGVSKPALANRWVAFHSALDGKRFGDGMIMGARRPEQLREMLEAVRDGPLPESVVRRIDAIWEIVKDDAPVDNYVEAANCAVDN